MEIDKAQLVSQMYDDAKNDAKIMSGIAKVFQSWWKRMPKCTICYRKL